METVRFSIAGMSCEGCAKGVAVTLRDMPGVASAEARFDTREAIVTYDDGTVSEMMLAREIESLGYKVVIS